MIYQGSCHCGKTAFEVEGDLHGVAECNCSICRRRGALWWFVARAQMRFSIPESDLSTYQFGKKHIRRHFCNVCGCAPLSTSLYNGVEMAAINVRCLEDVDLSSLHVKQVDGRSL
jgi:hypothetical protein